MILVLNANSISTFILAVVVAQINVMILPLSNFAQHLQSPAAAVVIAHLSR